MAISPLKIKISSVLLFHTFSILLMAQAPAVEIEGPGLVLPRMSLTQRDLIQDPIMGLTIFNTTNNCIEVYTGGGWFNLCSQTSSIENPIDLTFGCGCVYDNDAANEGGMAVFPDGSFVIVSASIEAASSPDITDSYNGPQNILIVKFDSDGNKLWDNIIGGAIGEEPANVIALPNGDLLVGGYTSSSASGDVAGINNGMIDYWIVKLNDVGSIIWEHNYGGSQNDVLTEIITTEGGGIMAVGFSNSDQSGDVGNNYGGWDVWLVKMDSLGVLQWDTLLGGSLDETDPSILQDDDGNYVIAASSTSTNSGLVTDSGNGSNDIWVVKVDSAGVIQWNYLYGGSSTDASAVIRESFQNGYIISCSSNSSMNNDVTEESNGGRDAWILHINEDGILLWNRLVGGSEEDHVRQISPIEGGYIGVGYSWSSESGHIRDVNPDAGVERLAWIFELDDSGQVGWSKLIAEIKWDTQSETYFLFDGMLEFYDIYPHPNGGYIGSGSNTTGKLGHRVLRLDGLGNYSDIKH